ncbi:MAG: YceI family protein [Thermoanaerobaculia bacterium]
MTQVATPTRTTWRIDPAHTAVEFSVKHMMFTTVRGRFKGVTGKIVADEDNPDRSTVEVDIDTTTIDTGVADRDAHLRSPDFLDAEKLPKMLFRSKRVDGAMNREGDRFRVTGDLTIRDTTLEVVLEVTFDGRGKDPWGGERAGFTARTEIDRREWGLRWNQALETGGILVGNNVKIELEVQAVKETGEGA